MTTTAPAAPAPRWWLAAGSLLLAGYAVVLVTWSRGTPAASGPAGRPRSWCPGARSSWSGAAGTAAGDTFVLDAPDATGTAIVAARVAPLPAARHARVDWKLAPPGAGEPALAFVGARATSPRAR